MVKEGERVRVAAIAFCVSAVFAGGSHAELAEPWLVTECQDHGSCVWLTEGLNATCREINRAGEIIRSWPAETTWLFGRYSACDERHLPPAGVRWSAWWRRYLGMKVEPPAKWF